MHHPRDRGRSSSESTIEILSAAHITIDHMQPLISSSWGQLQHPIESQRGAVGEVIEHHQLMTGLQQHQHRVAADEAGTTGD